MATYFHGSSEIQGDGSQTLVLMNHDYVNGYTDHQHHHHAGGLVFLNSTTGTGSLPPPSPNSQQFVGVPLLPTAPATSSSFHADGGDGCPPSLHGHHEIPSSLQDFVPRVEYNVWNPVDPTAMAAGVQRPQQGLSLSLSPQKPAYGSYRRSREVTVPGIHATSGGGERMGVHGISSATSTISSGLPGLHTVMLSSKYLKSAQQLLNEVVSVGDGLRMTTLKERTIGDPAGAPAAGDEEDPDGKRDVDLTTAERQEIHLKKAKLLGMLEEVEQRYRQYDHQMQMVISAFEQVAGDGSAKAYTTLALQTISKQFRCLKDVITAQIRVANRCLGEEDLNKTEVSRLKFVDHHLRQQRALQQLGMIQHNAWRPQRGLPERSVSILRAWLFEHFLHPYPKDSDKHMLAKQTGLTRSQVSNWFINARVRLWKPMVEEMYLEEIKVNEQKQSEELTTVVKVNQMEEVGRSMMMCHDRSSIPENQSNEEFMSPQDNSSTAGHPTNNSISAASASPASHSGFTQGSPTLKKPRCGETLLSTSGVPAMEMDTNPQRGDCAGGEEMISFRFGDDRHARDGYTLMSAPANFIGGFGSYTIGDIGRFHADPFPTGFSGNAVSLTLGLPHCEGLSLSEAHRNFLPEQAMELGRAVEMGNSSGYRGGGSGHSASLEDISRMPGRKQFVAAQLLPDFVS